jgi:hypothetical protein
MIKDKEARRTYMKKYMKERRDNRRKELHEKFGNKCIKCGSAENLQFDHIDPKTKVDTIANLIDGPLLEPELKKCQLLCAKCHEEKTRNDLGQQSARETHGTVSSHRYCRCHLCRAAHAEYMREWRLKKRIS